MKTAILLLVVALFAGCVGFSKGYRIGKRNETQLALNNAMQRTNYSIGACIKYGKVLIGHTFEEETRNDYYERMLQEACEIRYNLHIVADEAFWQEYQEVYLWLTNFYEHVLWGWVEYDSNTSKTLIAEIELLESCFQDTFMETAVALKKELE